MNVKLKQTLTILGALLLMVTIIASCSSSSDTESTSAAATGTGTGTDSQVDDAPDTGLTQQVDMTIEVTSPVFSRIRRIPTTHACSGRGTKTGQTYVQDFTKKTTYDNTSPPLEWTGIPEGTVSIVVIMDSDQVLAKRVLDPLPGQQVGGEKLTHWLIWNIPADATGLPEGVATTTNVGDIGPNTMQGINDENSVGYTGPCPIPVTVEQSGYKGTPKMVFSYVFRVYALDVELTLAPEVQKSELLEAIDGHVFAGGEIKGEYLAKKNYKEY